MPKQSAVKGKPAMTYEVAMAEVPFQALVKGLGAKRAHNSCVKSECYGDSVID
jgi:hypothetical protein